MASTLPLAVACFHTLSPDDISSRHACKQVDLAAPYLGHHSTPAHGTRLDEVVLRVCGVQHTDVAALELIGGRMLISESSFPHLDG